MELFIAYIFSIATNSWGLVALLYLMGMLVQYLITSHFMRKRKQILIEQYGHTAQSLVRLKLMSVLLFPVSWVYGILSWFESRKVRKEQEKQQDQQNTMDDEDDEDDE